MQNFRYHRTAPPKTLLEAAAWGDLVAAQTFLAKGAKPDQRDAQGWTALHHAVGYGQEPEIHSPTSRAPVKGLVDALLKAGAPLNSLTKGGMTPLMQAVAAQHEDASQWLLAAGADLRPADTVGGTALTHALWYNHCSPALAQRLLQKGSPVNLWDALWLADTTKALALVATAKVKATGPNDYTYLHLAAELGTCLWLSVCWHGAQPSTPAITGATPRSITPSAECPTGCSSFLDPPGTPMALLKAANLCSHSYSKVERTVMPAPICVEVCCIRRSAALSSPSVPS